MDEYLPYKLCLTRCMMLAREATPAVQGNLDGHGIPHPA